MKPRIWLAALAIGLLSLALGSTARADQWSRYYHWPYGSDAEHYSTPYEYQRSYDGRYRYPRDMRWWPRYPTRRSWLLSRKRYYRGYHFILDQF